MAESSSFEAPQVESQVRRDEEPLEELEEFHVEDDEEEEEEEKSQLGESQQFVELPSTEAEVREPQSENLESPSPVSSFPENGLRVNSAPEFHEEAELKEQVKGTHQEALRTVTAQCSEPQIQSQLESSACPAPLSELSPTSVTQCISSAQSPTMPKVDSFCTPEAIKLKSSDVKALSVDPVVKTLVSDGYNWRKYGQKQVKSPKGSRSYYKCTHSDCSAKKIQCSDHSGHVIEIVNKGMHAHDPPKKSNSTRENRLAVSPTPTLANDVTERPIGMPTASDASTSLRQPTEQSSTMPERKRQTSSGSKGNGESQVKEEQVNEPVPKRRLKKDNLVCSDSLLKPGKKTKLVVHASGDVGISGDGYRWRKYGQKMVKGNPHPRNYYRCTSAGCPVRKHIETAVDNTNAVIITYKGVHDHDMPVPKKRHGPPSAPLVAAVSPAAMNNAQSKKSDSFQNQRTSTQWSVGTEGELTGEALDLGGEKAMESARTLLSIGFEIKPC
ncbi:probable WRKY transcription factor 32 isoform X2 [Tripterygium wilfordii]|uniref:probable WRKY transcription factor 32 isoform X2 n=1 Tax=Tripterygium wilfordii TaxID=458696 RepID=UPI0018F82024|nr:probable WRKY transcription factor 32 isoform X2 [Tripterygium wilfordii]